MDKGEAEEDRPFGLCRLGPGAVTSLRTTQTTPGDGELRVTSQRRRRDTELKGDFERALMIHNFLNRSGLLGNDARVVQREVALRPGQTYPLLTMTVDAWTPFQIRINGEPQDFKRTTIGDHWLALGIVDEVEIAIAGHSFDPDRLELVRLDRLLAGFPDSS